MLKIAVCGLGTVGKSFVDHFIKYQDLIYGSNEKINCWNKIFKDLASRGKKMFFYLASIKQEKKIDY